MHHLRPWAGGRKWSGLQIEGQGAPGRIGGHIRTKAHKEGARFVTWIIEMMKDLQQEIWLLKEDRTQQIKDNVPPVVN